MAGGLHHGTIDKIIGYVARIKDDCCSTKKEVVHYEILSYDIRGVGAVRCSPSDLCEYTREANNGDKVKFILKKDNKIGIAALDDPDYISPDFFEKYARYEL